MSLDLNLKLVSIQGRDTFRVEQHGTAFEQLPSQAGVKVIKRYAYNKSKQLIIIQRSSQTSKVFYSVDKFIACRPKLVNSFLLSDNNERNCK